VQIINSNISVINWIYVLDFRIGDTLASVIELKFTTLRFVTYFRACSQDEEVLKEEYWSSAPSLPHISLRPVFYLTPLGEIRHSKLRTLLRWHILLASRLLSTSDFDFIVDNHCRISLNIFYSFNKYLQCTMRYHQWIVHRDRSNSSSIERR